MRFGCVFGFLLNSLHLGEHEVIESAKVLSGLWGLHKSDPPKRLGKFGRIHLPIRSTQQSQDPAIRIAMAALPSIG